METLKDKEGSVHHTAQDVESWSDDNFRLHVLQDPGGFFCKMKLRGKVSFVPITIVLSAVSYKAFRISPFQISDCASHESGLCLFPSLANLRQEKVD